MIRKNYWGGLRIKIIAAAFVPTAIILGAVVVVTLNAYQQVSEALAIERDQEMTRLSAERMSAGLARYYQVLHPWARTAFYYEGDLASLALALAEADDQSAMFDSILVLDSRGRVVVTVPDQPEIRQQDWADHEYFSRVSHSLEPAISDIVPDGPGGSEAIAFAVPIFGRQNEFLGAIVGMFSLDTLPESDFYAATAALLAEDSRNGYLVDGNGRIVYHPDVSRIGADVSDQEAISRVQGGENSSVRTVDPDGFGVVVSFAPVPDTTWGLVTSQTWGVIAGVSRVYQRYLLLLLGVGIALPALIVTVSVGWMIRPVRELIEAAQEVAGGNFSRRITASTGDEIEELAEQFNRMAAQLQESYTNLEQRVADRTRELAALNTIAGVVSRSLDLRDILRDALRETLQVMEVDLSGIYLVEQETGQLTLAAHEGLSPRMTAVLDRLQTGESFSGRVVQTGEPIVVSDVKVAPYRTRSVLIEEGVASLIVVPLSSRGRVLGTLVAATRQPREFSEQDVQLLTSIGNQIAVAVDNARLYEQSRQVAAMEERSRLAHDLHDAVSQTLWTASLIADVLPDLWREDKDEALRNLEKLRQLTRGALAEMRTLLLELRPSGLAEARLDALLYQLVEAMTGRKRMNIELDVRGDRYPLPADAKIALYRIAQEALNNTAKHARATHVVVNLRYEQNRVTLEVLDDGCGFELADVPPDSLGLTIMRERAAAVSADLIVDSRIGHGTRIAVIWPYVMEGKQL